MATGLVFEEYYTQNSTRNWMASLSNHTSAYKLWREHPYDKRVAKTGTACIGDAGSPLLYWDKPERGQIYLIGMVIHTWNNQYCGEFGVDVAISMIALVGWLTKYIDDVNPLVANQHAGPTPSPGVKSFEPYTRYPALPPRFG